MKVYLLLAYSGEKCSVVKVYSNREAAEVGAKRQGLKYESADGLTFHVIRMPVNGLLNRWDCPYGVVDAILCANRIVNDRNRGQANHIKGLEGRIKELNAALSHEVRNTTPNVVKELHSDPLKGYTL